MKIGINGYEGVIPRFGYDLNGLPNRVGSSEVAFEWLIELNKIDKQNEYVIFLPVEPTSDLPREREGWRYEILPNKPLWTIFALSPAIRKQEFDVFFSPTHYGPLFAPCPQVISILDISYKHFPKLFKKKDLLQLNLWGGYSVRSARKIITISRSSKDDIIKEYHVPAARVHVAYLGIKEANKSKMSKKEILEKYSIEKTFILFVGTLQPRKNIVRLVEAFSAVIHPRGESVLTSGVGEDLKLVIVGRRGWQYEEILEAPRRYGVEDRVRFLENVTDEELPAFYESAELFVLPSLYEGFGLPILEAMKYGCPVLTSNVSSLPEAGGDAAIYFNPEDVSDIAEKIEKVLSDKKLRDDMIKKGHEQVKKFSWEKSARQVLHTLEEAAKPVS
ncbi:MAG: hypothetical protein A3C30_00435 [Candidatus Levybacteria bacterium RIFCSPHIGHO2_02_FULL_40_18]|nr:MAG: hypothetical protein A2869_04130 [Candidatus Levybacteria bacterium RIFCSPHIGHO2_01_FULL_40_58]OGH27170.1 MAG: hypothetical protein A3C30_00435 [Candidatus Levybacteria bacterium RIFCSPHIGHO2_02_FULL_40_18]OGH31029.1 MAG: hypothetical protein A3E43_04850 [Candidatus Levybacteria bacterium RIFCSPHIGHO2_12_FULL_40_31]OGH41040.1 MAG: hypothetical protein A2894_02065 [Candidatus Levybacteria bacterium RIFCSPLOWO2_01_FULL_40_64]OGH49440.1 MAG: hypothetical protein A3I54_02230 [Candidatus Lev